jgi:hypothetical protein
LLSARRGRISLFLQTVLALYSVPVVITAQTIRAVLLARATDTTRGAFFSSSFAAQCRLALRPTSCCPMTRSAKKAYAVIREAMRRTGTVGSVVWTLRYGDEVRDEDDYFFGHHDPKPISRVPKRAEKSFSKGAAEGIDPSRCAPDDVLFVDLDNGNFRTFHRPNNLSFV